jgi:cation diffusion facilitator family transporter
MGVSLAVAVMMLGGKFAAYLLTGSDAIFSDAMESVVHLFATGFAGFSLWYAVRPPDVSHPYGHGKVAYFSAGFEGGLILLAAVAIIYSAVGGLVAGPQLDKLGAGVLITGGLAIVNLALGSWLVRVGRDRNSLVLISNGQHVLTDMWTSAGVVAGVALVWVTEIVWLDPIVAMLVAGQILWTAFKLIRRSVAGLMEEADSADTARILEALEQARARGDIAGFHQVRHRQVNDQRWIEYHLQFAGKVSLQEAHNRSHTVEDGIDALFPADTVYVTAHLEPDTHSHPEGFTEPDDPLTAQAQGAPSP